MSIKKEVQYKIKPEDIEPKDAEFVRRAGAATDAADNRQMRDRLKAAGNNTTNLSFLEIRSLYLKVFGKIKV